MAKDLKQKVFDMVVMTVARDATRTVLDRAKKAYKAGKSKANVRKRDRSEDEDELEP